MATSDPNVDESTAKYWMIDGVGYRHSAHSRKHTIHVI